jgi:hypothetical protein
MSSVGTVTELWAQYLHLHTWQRLEIFLSSKVSEQAIGSTQPHIQLVLMVLSLGARLILTSRVPSRHSQLHLLHLQTFISC